MVTVIIPVYNTEQYVRQAVESILSQTLCDLEVIAVDDGSTDHSLEILNELAASDPRLRVISQPNAGQSAARNHALQLARGEYLYFMDSDDLLLPDALQTCMELCEQHSLDFCFFDALSLDEDGQLSAIPNYNHNGYVSTTEVYRGTDLLRHLLKGYKLCTAPWADFVRRDFFMRAVVSFREGIIHEDELFTARLFLSADRVMALCRPFYHYRQRSDSTMGLRFSQRNLNGYYTVAEDLLKDDAQMTDDQRLALDDYLSYTLDAMMWRVHTMPFFPRLHAILHCWLHYWEYIRLRTFFVALLKR